MYKRQLVGSPRVNVILLGIGTLLSSSIGTTGASMLLVRPVIKMNSWRRNKAVSYTHLVIVRSEGLLLLSAEVFLH